MNILVTLDEKYLHPLTVLLKSMLISNPNSNFDVWVAHKSLTEDNFQTIYNCIDRSRMTIHPVIVPDYTLKNHKFKKRLSIATYYRLYAMDYLPESVDRVLYIDPDAVIINDLDGLYNIDMGDCMIAAAGHTYGFVEFCNKVRLNLESGRRYVNAGILLMDLKKMREFCTVDDICSYIVNFKGPLYQADQDIINAFFRKKIFVIDERYYNLDEKTLARYKNSINIDWVRRNAVIIHYNGKEKPWYSEYNGVLQDFFFQMRDAKLAETKKID